MFLVSYYGLTRSLTFICFAILQVDCNFICVFLYDIATLSEFKRFKNLLFPQKSSENFQWKEKLISLLEFAQHKRQNLETESVRWHERNSDVKMHLVGDLVKGAKESITYECE